MIARSTALAAVAALVVTGVAVAAARPVIGSSATRPTNHLAAGTLQVKATMITKSEIRANIVFTVPVRSRSVVLFTAIPCSNARCKGASTATATVRPGTTRLRFTGRVPMIPVVTRQGHAQACVLGRVADLGPDGRGKGTRVLTRTGHSGVTVCMKVPVPTQVH